MTRLMAQVQQPDGLITEIELMQQDKQEKAALKEYERRLRLTEDTPLMTQPLVDQFGYLGNTQYAQQVLDGVYTPPPRTDVYTS